MALSVNKIKTAGPGMHADGNGLYLRVLASGGKGWIFRFQLNGRRREMGLGSIDFLPLLEAREVAARALRLVREGVDPIDERDARVSAAAQRAQEVAAQSAPVTFRKAAEDYVAAHQSGWRNGKHAAQWTSTLERFAYPVVGDKPVADVGTDDIMEILRPIWEVKTETASRLRSRLELVLSAAKVQGHRTGENPATWRGHLDALLPPPGRVKAVTHHPALPYSQAPAFMAALAKVDGVAARALEFAIFTAARSAEVRLATWEEFDLPGRLWVVPASRMKARREHRVPLSSGAMTVLNAMPRGGRLVFASPKPRSEGAGALSDMTVAAVIKRMNSGKEGVLWMDPTCGRPIVPHGWRSSFRDWAGETTSFSREAVEHCLAHQLKDRAEAAYARGTLLAKRAALMEAWSDFLRSGAPAAPS